MHKSIAAIQLNAVTMIVLLMVLILCQCTFNPGQTSGTGQTVIPANEFNGAVIPGHRLKSDEIWSGSCRLLGDIVIPTGTTLRIMPGTSIRIATGLPDWDSGTHAPSKVDIATRGGTLIAQGTPGAVITFASDTSSIKANQWWGIGCSGGLVNLIYCHLSGSYYGMFVFSGTGVGVCESCMFSFVNMCFADFGPGNRFAKLSFANVSYSFFIYGKNKNVDISLCDFADNSSVDVQAIDSNQTIRVSNSNFASNHFNNLYISGNNTGSKGCAIFADNCFNIAKTNDNGSGTISITNPAISRIPEAGCGFTAPGINALSKKNERDPAPHAQNMREEIENALLNDLQNSQAE